MRDLLARLHQTRMILISVVITTTGVFLIALGQQIDGWQVWEWLKLAPFGEVGGILIGAGLLSIWIDHLFRREQEASDDLRLRKVLNDQAPVMRDAVLEAFAANDEDLARVATPETLDQIVNNSLALRLKDRQFADEIFTDIHDQAITATERWEDTSLDIHITPIPASKSQPAYFAVTARWEYTTIPHHAQRRFVALSDRREFAELSEEEDTSAWFLKDQSVHKASDREAFELLQFTVNGEERPIRRSGRKDSQLYTASVGTEAVEAVEPVTVAYTYRTVTPQHGHILFFDVEQPTKDLSVSFDYTGCELASVSAIDLIPSVRPTRIEHSPAEIATKTVRVEVDGWTFPRSGVAFVWTRQVELGADIGTSG